MEKGIEPDIHSALETGIETDLEVNVYSAEEPLLEGGIKRALES